MAKYIALLRAITPTDSRMKNENLRRVFEELGFTNVQSVISSGNIIFDSSETNINALQSHIEAAWPDKLGFHSTTIIRTPEQLEEIIKKDPFKGYEHNDKTYLTVTFLKSPMDLSTTDLSGRGYTVLAKDAQTIYSVVDLTTGKTANLMVRFERRINKEITTRTWKTVERLLKTTQNHE